MVLVEILRCAQNDSKDVSMKLDGVVATKSPLQLACAAIIRLKTVDNSTGRGTHCANLASTRIFISLHACRDVPASLLAEVDQCIGTYANIRAGFDCADRQIATG